MRAQHEIWKSAPGEGCCQLGDNTDETIHLGAMFLLSCAFDHLLGFGICRCGTGVPQSEDSSLNPHVHFWARPDDHVFVDHLGKFDI
ncbi:hypothetical protein VTN96DRAFT_3077 [Rasamsonia emersonii]